jgi:hypothetical protein
VQYLIRQHKIQSLKDYSWVRTRCNMACIRPKGMN